MHVRRVDLFVVDLDGTIADTREDIARSVNFVLAGEGRPAMATGDVWRCVGEGVATLIERVFNNHDGGGRGMDGAGQMSARVEMFRAHYAAHLLDTTRLYDGARSFLARVRAAVLTNKLEALSRRILDGLGVLDRVELIVGGDSLSTRKPDPRGVVEILTRCQVSPERAMFVGDSVIDVLTAKAASVRFVGVSYGYSTPAELVAAGALGVVDSLAEIET